MVSGSKTGGSRSRGDAILFTGPAGSGKTALLHALWTGEVPTTATSSAPFDATVPLAAAPGTTARLVDVPGHPRLAGTVRDFAAVARVVVVTVDAGGDEGHMAAAGEALFDLLTLPALEASATPLVVVGCKVDAAGARSGPALVEALEGALTAVKDTRSSLASTGEGEGSGVLGRKGKRFSFQRDATLRTSFAHVSAVKGTGMAALLDAILV